MIAQTWSEHCKHKIFQAEIRYNDGPDTTHIDGLFPTFIKKVTDEVGAGKSYLRSVFVDNSGVVAFDDSCVLCFKAETHNSPSALDPYGGAITGIVGVNRDIIGTGKGARPIFNTDVLCFGYPETERALLPDGLLHPTTVMDGVHRGIIDGGNQSGIPVVAGGFLFDESYTGKPLVYCGTGGVMPSDVAGEGSWINHVDAGDLAVMVGGRIGKDGIHGATFSSLDLSESSPTSAVQIGDPITQRKMLDFLIEARDHGLFKGITDNGAGGLSSSLGEMAEKSGGVVINLDLCPLKYHGLAPWEILVSESQERMSLAVAPERLDELLELAVRRDVEATAIGRFTDTGRVEVFYREERVADLDLAFLHDGVPQMKLDATWIPPAERPSPRDERLAVADDLRRLEVSVDVLARVAVGLLGDPNIRSKETLVRQYDHEVQARSVVKPFCGPRADGHTDGGVLRVDHNSQWGITVTHGICPRYGDYDTYDMAACAVDEAFRAHIALGGDPETSAALDNFCWPDPIAGPANPDGEYKLAQLVRANHGLSDTCRAYGVPLISGKDSMKNDSTLGGAKLSVRPTLLISLMGFVKDVRHTVTTDLKRPGNRLYLLGPTKAELGGGALERLLLQKHRGISPWTENRAAPPAGACPRVDPRAAITRYRSLHQAILDELVESAHDLSDGGLFVALCESAIAGDLGASVDVSGVYHESAADSSPYPLVTSLFSESASRFLVEVAPSNVAAFEALFPRDLVPLGEVVAEPGLRITHGGAEVLRTEIEQLRRHWNGAERGTTW
jgi:phosphoribosylformylglycinamidine synthase